MVCVQVIAETLLRAACRGDIRAAREIADRTEGRPPQGVVFATESEAALDHALILGLMTDEELNTMAEIYQRASARAPTNAL